LPADLARGPPPSAGWPRCAQHEAARAVLAAIGLLAIRAQDAAGYDLRSGCCLVFEQDGGVELVGTDGSTQPIPLSLPDAKALLAAAVEHATKAGLPWQTVPIALVPSPKLVRLARIA
jgi:hypothetical protein